MTIGITPLNYSAFMLEHNGVLALSRAEQAGLHIDLDHCKKMTHYLQRQIGYYSRKFEDSDLAYRWQKVYGKSANYNSDAQLSHILFKNMKIEAVKFTSNGNPSTDEEALSALGLPEIDHILKIRHLDKVLTTYIGGFLREQVNGVLHPFFNLHIPLTFRSSSDSPNFQNIPNRDPELKRICRKAIKARKGHRLGCWDYSGVEVKISAAYHVDPNMITYILDKSTDMHRDTAMDAFLLTLEQMTKPIRQTAKGDFVFPEFYGDYYRSCAKAMWNHAKSETHNLKDGTKLLDHLKKKGIKNYDAFENHIKKVEEIFWQERFAVYAEWKKTWWDEYCDRGYFDMLSGFRCSGIMERNDAVNYPVQGAAFHCLLLAFIIVDKIQQERSWKSRLVGQIHDELIIDIFPDEEEEVRETVEWVMTKEVPRIFGWINVPLEVESEISPTDGSWYDKVAPCSCGGLADMFEEGTQYVMACTKCAKETALFDKYDDAVKAWKDLK